MRKIIVLLLTIMVLSPLAAGGKQESAPAQTSEGAIAWIEGPSVKGLPGVNPLKVTGNIITAGSSTVFPLSERMAERFKEEGYSGTITIDSIGSGAGFERFTVAGETDIANASRGIKAAEIENAREIGREPIEFRVGTDALAVTVSKENTFLKNVTMDELARIFSSAELWSDVNPSWPNQPILRFIPGTDSGTFDYFSEEVFDKQVEPLLNASNLQLSEDDNILVQGIKGSPYAIGFFGYAYYAENEDALNIVDIEGVQASAENVDNGTYPLARPLFIYSDATIMREKPQVAAFIDFYLSYVDEEVIGVGYFPANEAALEKGRAAWLEAMDL
ncbi:PstS family phosphate ABC transporter substrate-binding protein [Pleomorphochaeta sp. DL1XJH-081]|jgi:phosphate transport system substrate-binding protein|uniref:PstS family phosphate ABC transporter substrate-binding protein n=1 Tax=Pleomorphochaeta sp. DL1XJH-081 TaxID=3409690 RepID=UPI003BB76210